MSTISTSQRTTTWTIGRHLVEQGVNRPGFPGDSFS